MYFKTIGGWLVALIAVYALYFWAMAERGLVSADEPRYASVAHEMAASGDWVTPRLDGQPWFEKPALLYWMGATAEGLGLAGDRATRWPVALFSALFLLYFYRVLSDAFGAAAAAYSSMILATSAGWVALSQTGSFDLPLSVTLGTALLVRPSSASSSGCPCSPRGWWGLSWRCWPWRRCWRTRNSAPGRWG